MDSKFFEIFLKISSGRVSTFLYRTQYEIGLRTQNRLIRRYVSTQPMDAYARPSLNYRKFERLEKKTF